MSSAESSPSPSGTHSIVSGVLEGTLPMTPPSSIVKLESSKSDRPPKTNTPKPMSPPNSFSEWQLLAVLQRANLVQYYDTFIAQGGDDINQIMQCDEHEFLEIMSLVGMLSKPLHVRRLQRALTEFSKDQASFNVAAMHHIGAPPPPPSFSVSNDSIQYLMPEHHLPGFTATLNSLAASPGVTSSAETSTNIMSTTTTCSINNNNNSSNNSVPLASNNSNAMLSPMAPSSSTSSTTIGATANISTGERLRSLPSSTSSAHKEKERSTSPLSVGGDFVSLGDAEHNLTPSETPILNDVQIRRIASCAESVFRQLPVFTPKLIQNKKRISREVLDLMTMESNAPGRLEEYRKYSAIYGRFDAKRNPNKILSLHEVSVNEAAAQLCLLMPALLTRRDELFPLARQVVRDAGYHYMKNGKRKASPCRTPTASPPLIDCSDDYLTEPKRQSTVSPKEKGSYLERWAATRLNLHQSEPSSSDVI